VPLLSSSLGALTKLRFLDLDLRLPASTCNILFTLPSLTHLVLHDLPSSINLAEGDYSSCSITVLSLEIETTIRDCHYPFLDTLHFLPKLRELLVKEVGVVQILGRFLSNGSPPLRLDSLGVFGELETEDYEVLFEYLSLRGSNLQALSIASYEEKPPEYHGNALSSLQVYRGPIPFSPQKLTPSIRELRISTTEVEDPHSILFNTYSLSNSLIRVLEIPVESMDISVVHFILEHFPELEILKFLDINCSEVHSEKVCAPINALLYSALTQISHYSTLHPTSRQLLCLHSAICVPLSSIHHTSVKSQPPRQKSHGNVTSPKHGVALTQS
jgi:hypothetical protein